MRGLPNKFNNTRARMSIYHIYMTLRLLWKFYFCRIKRYNFVITTQRYGRHNVSRKSVNH